MSKKVLIPIEVDGGTADSSGIKLTRMTSASANIAGSPIGVDATGNIVKIAAGASSGAYGNTTVDFGAFPGKSDASIAITGQAGILAGSSVSAWLRPVATADHSADEHLFEKIEVMAGNIVAGTGFTIYVRSDNNLTDQNGFQPMVYGLWSLSWKWE